MADLRVGKAIPEGARKGVWAPKIGRALFKRLREHAESIRQADNLELDDFTCRYLVLDHIRIPLGESLLIEWFAPLWNRYLEGFGIHSPGGGRGEQKTSRWDTLHPGRPYAKSLPPSVVTAAVLAENVRAFLKDSLGSTD